MQKAERDGGRASGKGGKEKAADCHPVKGKKECDANPCDTLLLLCR